MPKPPHDLRAYLSKKIAKFTLSELDSRTNCTLWQGALANGYPCLRVNGKCVKVTRLLFEARLGRKLEPTEHILHSCDTPRCINERHLHIGTHKQNMREMFNRRPPKRVGNGVGKSKLTWAQVRYIRGALATHRALAHQFGVTNPTIHCIKTNKTWKELSMTKESV